VVVIGIDPGSKITGFGIIRKSGQDIDYLSSGTINLENISDTQLKLKKIYNEFSSLIKIHHPESVAVEDIFYATNVKSTIKLGYVKGVILLAAIDNNLQTFEYSPTNIKSAVTGNGRADKESVKNMLRYLVKGLPDTFHYTDESDAIAIAYCHINTISFNRRVQ